MSNGNRTEDKVSTAEVTAKVTIREKIAQFLSRYDLTLCLLCYVVGVVWFLSLGHPELNGRTYFSENALLPGLVEPDIYHDHGAAEYLQQLKQEFAKHKSSNEQRFKIPVDWLTRVMNDIGLDTYVQNYSFKYPHHIHKSRVYSGRNVYGILRAPRTPGTEALVLSAPYRPEPFAENTLPGVALILGVAKAFRSHLYWAKDIIFLITEDEEIGMQAWLSAYHHTYNDYIMAGELPGRSGSIQAALNLEMGTDTVSRMNIRIEGLNGQLPNLDFVNTAVRLCKKEGLTPTLHKRVDHAQQRTVNGVVHSLKTMLLQMFRLATGSPSGNHGLFHRYNIEAITLHGIKLKNSKATFSFTDVARIVEGIFRSLNNLLERFHQSFFFYLLPSVEMYVSIGVYMPPLGVMALPVVIKVLSLWLNRSRTSSKNDSVAPGTCADVETKKTDCSSSDPSDQQQQDSPSGKIKSDVKRTTIETSVKKSVQSKDVDQSTEAEENSSLFSYVLCILTSLFYGICAFYGPDTFVRMSHDAHIETHTAVTIGFAAVHLLIIASPFTLNRWLLSSRRYGDSIGHEKTNAKLIKCFALIMFGILLGTTAVINVSLAFFVAITAIPIIVIVSPTRSRILNGLQRLALVIISPFSAVCLASFVSVLLHQKTTDSIDLWKVAGEAWSNVEHGILLSIVQMDMFDNWTYGLASLAYLTNWALFWQVTSYKPIS